MATFITYVQLNADHMLEPSVAFVSLSLLNILRQPINMLPTFVSDIVQVRMHVQRTIFIIYIHVNVHRYIT